MEPLRESAIESGVRERRKAEIPIREENREQGLGAHQADTKILRALLECVARRQGLESVPSFYQGEEGESDMMKYTLFLHQYHTYNWFDCLMTSLVLLCVQQQMICFQSLRILRYSYRVVNQPIANNFPPTGYYLYNDSNQKISFWNDVNLDIRDDQLTCCVEIPRSRIAKMEVIKELPHHPIVQDTRQNFFTKKQELRYYAQFPYFNYGFLPQTWQSTLIKSDDGLLGDNDPVDIVEVGSKKFEIGNIFRARVLGAFCLIDQGEVDWKVVLMNREEAEERNVKELGDIEDHEKVMREITRWFKGIKVFDGKKENTIAYDDKIFSKDETMEMIRKTHEHWKELKSGRTDEFEVLRREMKF